MARKTKTIKLKQIVNAPAAEVFTAFTNATALCEWLCNVAQADPHEGGRLYLWWSHGYYASGEFTSLRPGERIFFSWHGRDDPGASRVKISLKTAPASTLVSLSHVGLGTGKEWRQAAKEIRRGWKQGLENLQSVLETGQDLRFVHQPVLGLSGVSQLDAEAASRLGQPSEAGLRLAGVIDGMGAQAAGLQKDDVITKIARFKVNDYPAVIAALKGKQPGDKVKVTYYRDGKKNTTRLQLSRRPLPEIPVTPEELSAAVQRMFAQFNAELDQSLEGVSEADASCQPNPEEWSIKDILAHLIVNERERHSWFTGLIQGQEADFVISVNLPTRIRATIAAFPTLASLLDELKRNEAETAAMVAALPFDFVIRKRSYWRLGYNLMQSHLHFQHHLEQIQAVLQYGREHNQHETTAHILSAAETPEQELPSKS